MFKLSFLSLFVLSFQSIFAQQAADTTNNATSGARIEFSNDTYDFGDIFQGDQVEHVFTFKNTGNAPLVLQGVITTCGCTAPKWPKEPIAPGEEGEIKILFNSSGRMGWQNKIITVRSNAYNADLRLKISAMVIPSKKRGG
ncbi:MAG: DUF1573 domain-containing protein [Cyclobacteriaceae bacterium]